jgi:hypothetical protein
MNDLRHAFPGQEQDEAVFIFVRPYWLAFLPTALIFLFLIGVSAFLQIALANGLVTFLSTDVIGSSILALGIFQLIAITVFFITVFDFYFDIVLVTDRELVDIDQEQLFYRRVSRLNLEDVEDVTTVVKGFFQTTFQYGSVEDKPRVRPVNFEIENIKNPTVVEAIISDLAAQAKSNVPDTSREPEGDAKAVLDGKVITDPADLITLGAMAAGDDRFTS